MTPDTCWSLLLALANARRAATLPNSAFAIRYDTRHDRLDWLPPDVDAPLAWAPGDGWRIGASVSADVRDLLDLYLPLIEPRRSVSWVLAQLGQSIDGYIATRDGDAYYVTGPENLTHLHRLRALSDAVIVGANTVAIDNPRLTTRRVPGPNPVRVVLDASGRLELGSARLITDNAARTLIVRQTGLSESAVASAEVLNVAVTSRGLDLTDLLRQLRALGLGTILVEGGGLTVSRFLEAHLLDRLHIAVAPLILGSGRPGLTLPPIERLSDALRPLSRVYRLGRDILWDFDLRAAAPASNPDASGQT
ncbi:MAG: RibD family protein [Thiotrichales bacterium]